jgi:hypothetical protein
MHGVVLWGLQVKVRRAKSPPQAWNPLINATDEIIGLERPGCVAALTLEGADNCDNLIIGK